MFWKTDSVVNKAPTTNHLYIVLINIMVNSWLKPQLQIIYILF